MPYISAFSRDGRASMILGVMMSPSAVVLEAWRSRRVDRRRGALMGLGCVLLESALRLLAIRSVLFVCVAAVCLSVRSYSALETAVQVSSEAGRRRERVRRENFACGRRGRAVLTRSSVDDPRAHAYIEQTVRQVEVNVDWVYLQYYT